MSSACPWVVETFCKLQDNKFRCSGQKKKNFCIIYPKLLHSSLRYSTFTIRVFTTRYFLHAYQIRTLHIFLVLCLAFGQYTQLYLCKMHVESNCWRQFLHTYDVRSMLLRRFSQFICCVRSVAIFSLHDNNNNNNNKREFQWKCRNTLKLIWPINLVTFEWAETHRVQPLCTDFVRIGCFLWMLWTRTQRFTCNVSLPRNRRKFKQKHFLFFLAKEKIPFSSLNWFQTYIHTHSIQCYELRREIKAEKVDKHKSNLCAFPTTTEKDCFYFIVFGICNDTNMMIWHHNIHDLVA